MTIHEELKELEKARYTDVDSKRLTIDSFLATKIEELWEKNKQICSICGEKLVCGGA